VPQHVTTRPNIFQSIVLYRVYYGMRRVGASIILSTYYNCLLYVEMVIRIVKIFVHLKTYLKNF